MIKRGRCALALKGFEGFFKAGEIARGARRFAASLVESGVSVFELCERVEDYIRRMGGEPAFPCNVCINDVAAHYTAKPGDTLEIPEGSVVKVDLGVQVDGYPVDTAVTVVLDDRLTFLKEAAEEALRRALKTIGPGVNVSEVGRVVLETAKSYGLKPIRNLSGHEVARYNLHAGLSIPNVPSYGGKFKPNRVYAVEPFMTTSEARGLVVEAGAPTIYRCISYKRVRDRYADMLLKKLWFKFRGLPFTERWFRRMGLKPEVVEAWETVKKLKMVRGYKVLKEASGGLVSQAEESILVTEDGCIELTGFLE